jgi:hypothetical protein
VWIDVGMNTNLATAKTVAEIAEKTLTALGIFVGAVWAYYKYVRGRTFRNRLEMSISGTYTEGVPNLVLTIELKNIGASDIHLRQQGTAAVIEMLNNGEPTETAGPQEGPIAVKILEDHEWIESSETISEQHFVRLPSPIPQALRLRLRVVSQGKKFSNRTAWTRISIAVPQPKCISGGAGKEQNDG